MKEKFFNLANIASLSRVVLAAVFVILIAYGKNTAALITFIIAFLTDAIDGYLARSTNQHQGIGVILDPICDKILITSAVVALFIKFNLSPWVLVIFLRDVVVALGTLIYLFVKKKKNINFKANIINKILTFLQVIAIISIITIPRYQNIFILVVLIVTLFAMPPYVKRFFDSLKK